MKIEEKKRASLTDFPPSIKHLTSYPLIHDGIETYKSHPLGRKSIDLTQTGYSKFLAPFVPYAQGPYNSYAAPYVHKADAIASSGLSKLDERFPVVKSETAELKTSVLDLAYLPLRKATEGKEYVTRVYGEEYEKHGGGNSGGGEGSGGKEGTAGGGEGGYIVVTSGKAVVTTGIAVTSSTIAWLSAFLRRRRDEGRDFASQKYRQGQGFAEEKYRQGQE